MAKTPQDMTPLERLAERARLERERTGRAVPAVSAAEATRQRVAKMATGEKDPEPETIDEGKKGMACFLELLQKNPQGRAAVSKVSVLVALLQDHLKGPKDGEDRTLFDRLGLDANELLRLIPQLRNIDQNDAITILKDLDARDIIFREIMGCNEDATEEEITSGIQFLGDCTYPETAFDRFPWENIQKLLSLRKKNPGKSLEELAKHAGVELDPPEIRHLGDAPVKPITDPRHVDESVAAREQTEDDRLYEMLTRDPEVRQALEDLNHLLAALYYGYEDNATELARVCTQIFAPLLAPIFGKNNTLAQQLFVLAKERKEQNSFDTMRRFWPQADAREFAENIKKFHGALKVNDYLASRMRPVT